MNLRRPDDSAVTIGADCSSTARSNVRITGLHYYYCIDHLLHAGLSYQAIALVSTCTSIKSHVQQLTFLCYACLRPNSSKLHLANIVDWCWHRSVVVVVAVSLARDVYIPACMYPGKSWP